MAVGCESDSVFAVHETEHVGGETAEVFIQRLVGCCGVVLELVERSLQRRFLALRHRDVAPQAEIFSHHFLHGVPRKVGVLCAVVLETSFRHASPVDVGKCRVVVALVHTDCHAAGVVVGSDDDKRLVGMLDIEIVCHAD